MATFVAYGLTDPAGGFAPVTASDELGGSLGSDLFVRAATIARANAGAAVLYGDANTTTITLGGGAAQTSVTIGKAGQAINLLGASVVIASAVTLSNTGISSTGVLTVSSTGVLSLDSTTNAIQTDATSITADAGLSIVTTTTGGLSLDSGTTGAINLGTGASAKTVTIGNAISSTSIDINAGTGGALIDSTGTVSVDAAAASNFTVTGSGASLTLEATGGSTQQVIIQSAGTGPNAVRINASAGGIDWDAAAGFTLDGGSSSSLRVTSASADLVISASGGGAGQMVTISSAGPDADALTLTASAGGLLIDAAGAIEINSSAGTLNLGNDAVAQAVNVGTGAAARNITVGNVTGATALVYNAGTGGHAFTGPMGFFGHVVVSQQTNIVSLTDNSGGAANDTIASITNAANAGSADVGPTADAIADLAAKVNGILTILSNVGLMA